MIFYIVYGSLFVLVVHEFGPALARALSAVPVHYGPALVDSISYSGYNIAILPALIFVARNFASRQEALIAGALAGPLILLPGFAFLLALSGFYPRILEAPLPVTVLLASLGKPVLTVLVRLVLLGAFIKSGVGLLHGVNERFAASFAERGKIMPRGARPAIALGVMVVAVYLASSLGIVELIGRGYRYSSYYFLVIFVIPAATKGLWLIVRPRNAVGDVQHG